MTDHDSNQRPGRGSDHSALDPIRRDFDVFHAMAAKELNAQGLALVALAVFVDPTATLQPGAPAGVIPVVATAGIADPFHINAATLARIYRAEADRVEEAAERFDEIQAENRVDIEKFEATP